LYSTGCTVKPFTLARVTTTGNDVLVGLTGAGDSNAARVLRVTDDASNIYVPLIKRPVGLGAVEIWYSHNVRASTAITVTYNVAPSSGGVVQLLAEYSGVSRYANLGSASGTGTTATLILTTQNTNNFVAVVFGSRDTLSANTGNLRVQNGSLTPNSNGAINDNTAVSPSPVTNAVTIATSQVWAGVAVELESGAKTADENEMDALACRATPAAGSLTIFCTSVEGMLIGRYKVHYTVG